jgi:hypothetical protein
MALNDYDQVRIREYLLGKLTDDEQEKLEQRLMVEDDLFQELEISKGELIEEYRAGELSQRERQSFAQFLATPEGRRRHAFTVAIACLERTADPPPQPRSWLERFLDLFKKPEWAIPAVSAALIIIVAVIWIRSRQQPPKFVAVTLTNAAISRAAGDNQYQRVTVPPDASELRISLTLPQAAAPGARYSVELDNRQETTVFKPSGQDANSVSVTIPARKVPPGLYALTIYELKPDGTKQQVPGTYFFIRQ